MKCSAGSRQRGDTGSAPATATAPWLTATFRAPLDDARGRSREEGHQQARIDGRLLGRDPSPHASTRPKGAASFLATECLSVPLFFGKPRKTKKGLCIFKALCPQS